MITDIKTLLATATLTIFAFAGIVNAAEMRACDDDAFVMVIKAVEGAEGDAKVVGMKDLKWQKQP